MSRIHVYSDESGCFAFKRNRRASKYFLVCTVAMADCSIGASLLDLRRDMIWRGMPVGDQYHASEDRDEVREEVYDLISKHELRIDATLLEKSKARPHVRATRESFFKYAWFYHFRHVGPKVMAGRTEIAITAAAIGTNKDQAVFTAAVNDVLQQTIQRQQWRTFFPRAVADPCVQVADYCAWALRRKWERNDETWYDKISNQVSTQYDLWKTGAHHYY